MKAIILILITPVNNTKFKLNKPLADYKSRPISNAKSDTFERINPSFKSNYRLPVDYIGELLKNASTVVREASTKEDKEAVIQRCAHMFEAIILKNFPDKSMKEENIGMYNFFAHRFHKLMGPLSELNGFKNLTYLPEEMQPKYVRETTLDDFFDYVGTKTMQIVRHYEKLLDAGIDNNTMHPREVFNSVLDTVSSRKSVQPFEVEIKGTDVLDKYPNGIPMPVFQGRLSDHDLHEIFYEVISNAEKFSRENPEGAKIKIAFGEEILEGQNYLAFSVSDNGIGMSKEEQEKFFREENSGVTGQKN